MPIVLTGTKSDLRKDKDYLQREGLQVVNSEEGQKIAKEVGAQYYSECSAKSQEGLKETFNFVIECVLDPKSPDQSSEKKKTGKCSLL